MLSLGQRDQVDQLGVMVTTGLSNDTETEIVRGLSEGDLVVSRTNHSTLP